MAQSGRERGSGEEENYGSKTKENKIEKTVFKFKYLLPDIKTFPLKSAVFSFSSPK